MKTLFFFPNIYPCETGGMEVFNYSLSVNADLDNTVIYTKCKNLDVPNRRIISDRLFLIRRFGFGNLSISICTLFYLIFDYKKIDRIYTGTTSNSAYLGYLLPLIHKIFKIKYVIHLHGGGMRPWSPYRPFKRLFLKAEKIFAVSLKLKDEYELRANRQIELLYPMIEFKRASESIQSIKERLGFHLDSKIILYVGSLKPLKSPETTLNAFLSLSEEDVIRFNLILVFVGMGELKESLIIKSKQSKFVNRIIFTGLLGRQEVGNYYKIANIYVISSHFEGTPLSLLEALFYGLPCIGTNVNGIQQIIKHAFNGLLFEKNNSEELKNSILELLENTELMNCLKLNAVKSYNENYNFENYMNDFSFRIR